MPSFSERPAHGLRFRLERIDDAPPRTAPTHARDARDAPAPLVLVYEGEIATPERDFPVRARVDAATLSVDVETEGGAELADKTRLLLRSVLKHAASDGAPAPRRIQRWRT